jgi:dimeric dUTPase (all-alpha-NTP-PPase superfamily)
MLCKIADSMYEKGFNNESMSSCEYALKTIQELNDADNYAKSQELCTISNLLHKNKFDVKSISVYMQVLETAKNIDWNRMTKNYESNYWDEDEYPKLCNAIEWFEKLIISLENNPYAAKDDLISLYITILDFVSEFSCDPCEKLENLFKVINSFEKRITSNKIIGLYDKSIKIAEYRWQDHYYHYSPNILKSFEKLINSFENNPHTKKEEVFKIYNVILDIIQNSSSSDDLEESENLFKVINSFEKRITSNKIIGLYDKALDVLGKFNDENISENLFKIIESFEKRVSSDKLLELYDKSIKIAENIWDKWHSSLILLKMANLLWHKGLRDKSINTYDKSIKLSKKINSNKSKSIVLSKISKSLSKNGLIDKAYTVTCEIPLEEYKSETLKHISGRSNP